MSKTPLAAIPDEPLWDSKDVMTYLKVSRSWVYLHAEDGSLPSVRIGGLRRFIPEQIRAYARGDVTSPKMALSGKG